MTVPTRGERSAPMPRQREAPTVADHSAPAPGQLVALASEQDPATLSAAVPRRLWAALTAWVAFWAVIHAAHVGGSWHYFRQGARLLLTGGADGGLHLYAAHPELQIGPLSFAVAAPLSWGPVDLGKFVAAFGMTAAGLVVLVVASRLMSERHRTRRLAWAGAIFLPAWTELATSAGHLDDVLALLLAVCALRAVLTGRPIASALLLAAATDAKPWAAAFLPLLFVVQVGRARAVAFFACGVAAGWLPFVLADAGTLHAARFAIDNAAGSSLRALGVHSQQTPRWDRLAQLVAGLAVGTLCALRRRAAGVLVVGVAARLLLDPSVYTYYTAGLMAVTVVYDLVERRAVLPWATISAGIFLYVPWLLLFLAPGLTAAAGALRAGYLLALIACVCALPSVDDRPATEKAPQSGDPQALAAAH